MTVGNVNVLLFCFQRRPARRRKKVMAAAAVPAVAAATSRPMTGKTRRPHSRRQKSYSSSSKTNSNSNNKKKKRRRCRTARPKDRLPPLLSPITSSHNLHHSSRCRDSHHPNRSIWTICRRRTRTPTLTACTAACGGAKGSQSKSASLTGRPLPRDLSVMADDSRLDVTP